MQSVNQYLRSFLGLLLCSFVAIASSANEVKIEHVYAFDKYEIESFEEIRALDQTEWKSINPERVNLGLKDHYIWLKVEIPNGNITDDLVLRIENPTLFDVSIFDDAGQMEQINAFTNISQQIQFGNRNFLDWDILFNVIAGKTVYLKIKSYQSLVVPLILDDAEGQRKYAAYNLIIISMFLGIVLIMFVYNLFITIGIKSNSYFYYVIYIVTLGVTHLYLSGFGFQFLWPTSLKSESVGFNIFGSLSAIFAILFSQQYLKLKRYLPIMYQVFNYFIAVFILSILLTLHGFDILTFRIRQIATLLVSMFSIATSIAVVRLGYRPALFYTWAWGFMYTGVMIFILSNLGWIPHGFLTKYALLIGMSLKLALLSFGLANRITIIKKDRDRLQVLAIKNAKANEDLIVEQNVILEKKVKQRTHALNESHNQLVEALNNLKQTQNRLIEQEKMSSLGILTAGIAHEINNPINFVVGNIIPLERNLNDLLNLIDEIENIVQQASPTVNEAISEKKKKLDYDILVEESRNLLEGIREGAQRTAIIVKGLKTFSRMDGESWLNSDFNIGIESSLVILNNKMHNIEIHKKLGQIPEVYSQPGKINQTFLNLISNSVDAINEKFDMKKGGEISIQSYFENNEVKVIISDNGIGMSEETLSKIFNPFYTTKAVGKGTGLGMSIAFTIVEEHGGTMKIDSVKNEGTTISLSFPLNFEGNKG